MSLAIDLITINVYFREIIFYSLTKFLLVPLYTYKVVRFCIDNYIYNFMLAGNSVNSYYTAFKVKSLYKQWYRLYFVALLTHLLLTKGDTIGGSPGTYYTERLKTAITFLFTSSAYLLAVYRYEPTVFATYFTYPRTEPILKFIWRQNGKYTIECVVGGDTFKVLYA